MTDAVEVLRRGPLYRWHQEAGAEPVLLNGGVAPWRYPGSSVDPSKLALADLSLLPRVGVKGWKIWERLANLGVVNPTRNNMASELLDGGACLRLGEREAMVLGSIAGASSAVEHIEGVGSVDGCYLVSRRDTHVWFVLTGDHVPSLLSKICSIDLRYNQFDNCAIAQTNVAGVGAIIVRRDFPAVAALHLLSDNSSARYLWLCLMRAAEEFQGGAIGLEILKKLASEARR
jgi:sarcosine oxidase, subunit gamma